MIHALQASLAAMLASAAVVQPPAQDDIPLIAAALDAGRLTQAEVMLGRVAVEHRSDEIEILEARLALAQGRDDAAYHDFTALAARQPDRCAVIAGLGIAAAQLGNWDPAIAALTRVTGGCHVDWRAWNALGVAYDARGRWDEARAALDHALSLAGRQAVILNNLGISLLHQHRFAEAAGYLRLASLAQPDDPRIVDNLDIASASIGLAPVRDPARDDAARWSERLANAGDAAIRAGRTAEARAYLAQALTIGPVLSASADRALRDLH